MALLQIILSAVIFFGALPSAGALPLSSSSVSLKGAYPFREAFHDDAGLLKRDDEFHDRASLALKPDGTFDFDDFLAFAQQAGTQEATEDMLEWAEAIAYNECELNKSNGLPCSTESAPEMFSKIIEEGSKDQDPYAVETLLIFLRWRKSLLKAPTGAEFHKALEDGINSLPKNV